MQNFLDKTKIGVLRAKAVAAFLGISRSTLYAKLDPNSKYFDPTFPKKIRLGNGPNGAVGWHIADIIEWVESRQELKEPCHA